MTLAEAREQRPKIEDRINAAYAHLLSLMRHQPGGFAALEELKLSILALEIQNKLEIELIANGRAPLPEPAPVASPATTTTDDDL